MTGSSVVSITVTCNTASWREADLTFQKVMGIALAMGSAERSGAPRISSPASPCTWSDARRKHASW